ncbi:hypothetical protein Mal65_11240 [Crateriforma conspicua]|nr:hypothetical protein Mal65_11240 [Crateriforma conspicua]
MSISKATHLMRPVGVIPSKNEPSVWEPAHHQRQKPAHQPGRSLVSSALGSVGPLVSIKSHQQRQRHRSANPRQSDEDC